MTIVIFIEPIYEVFKALCFNIEVARRSNKLGEFLQGPSLLLDLGGFPAAPQRSAGWMYDAKRKLVYVVNANRWGVWALKLDLKTAKTLTKEP